MLTVALDSVATLPLSLAPWPAHSKQSYSPTLVVFQVSDASMAPTIAPGVQFFAEPVEPTDWEKIQNRVVVVQTAAGGIAARIVENTLGTAGSLLLHFDGRPKQSPQPIEAKQIEAIWLATRLAEPAKIR